MTLVSYAIERTPAISQIKCMRYAVSSSTNPYMHCSNFSPQEFKYPTDGQLILSQETDVDKPLVSESGQLAKEELDRGRDGIVYKLEGGWNGNSDPKEEFIAKWFNKKKGALAELKNLEAVRELVYKGVDLNRDSPGIWACWNKQ